MYLHDVMLSTYTYYDVSMYVEVDITESKIEFHDVYFFMVA